MSICEQLTTQQIIDLWFHYEQIAMHFNGLIIQYRLQIFGGLGVLSSFLIFLVNGKIIKEKIPYVRMLIVSALSIVFIAAAALDIFYYQKLLSGAVKAIVQLEKHHPTLNISTMIKAEVDSTVVTVVYSAVIILLLSFNIWAIFDFRKKK